MCRYGEMKRILQILPLLFWLGCGGDSSLYIHPFAGNWEVTDYCVYESDNCNSNCNNQEFIPIFYQGGFPNITREWSYLSEGRVITIDENGDAGGGFNFSKSQQNFTAGRDGYSWSPFPGITNYVPSVTYISGTCILNDDKNTLELQYNENAICIGSTSEGWDGSIWLEYADSIECYNYYNDTIYYYETWVPEYCAKITLTKQ